ncbi:MAG: hypothetical protein ACLFRN_08945 [Halothece sp.]
MTPPRTFREITTPREIPQNRYLKSRNGLHDRKQGTALKQAPYTTREPQRTPITEKDNLTATTDRHVFKMKRVPKRIRLQIAQIKQTGILE